MNKFLLLCRSLVVGLAVMAGMASASALTPFSDDSQIYGYLSSPAGMYSLNAEGYNLLWEDAGYKSRFYVPMTSGWVDGDRMCGYATDGWDAFYVEYDWATGEILSSKSLSANVCPNIATRNPADGNIYGFYIKSGAYKFIMAPASDPTALTAVADVDGAQVCYGLSYDSSTGSITGVRLDGTFVSVNADGSQEVILSTGMACPSGISYTALTYSPADEVYYWNPTNNDWESTMYVVDLVNRSIEQISTFPNKQFRFLLSTSENVDQGAPVAPEIVGREFVGGSTDGKFIVRMPSTLESGDAIEGTVSWTALVDGETAQQGEAAAGAEVTVAFEAIEPGIHTFAFTASIADKTSRAASENFFVGIDTPKAPANVVLSTTEVTWEAVTEGVNGGYVDTEAIAYAVCINGESVGTTSETTMPLSGLAEGSLRHLTATVTATAGGLTSAAATSNGIIAGNAMELPLFMQPTATDMEFCQVVDQDADGNTWTFNEREGAFYSSFNYSEQCNDWLILPPVDLAADKTYYFSMQARRMRSYFDGEAIEVRAAQEPTPEALAAADALVQLAEVPTAYEEINATLTPAVSGKWYFAIHAVSLADQAGMYVREILISDNGITAQSPAAVTSLAVEAAAGAALEATVTFTLPTATVGGDELGEDTVVEATVTAAASVTVSGAPGERVSATVPTAQGDNRITVEPAIGELKGIRSYIEVYTGYDIPGAVSALAGTVGSDMMSVDIAWTAPADGYNGGIIDPEAIVYNIYELKSSSLGSYWELIAEGVDETAYTFTTDIDRQDVYTLGVAAVNVAGVNPEPTSVLAVLGTPHQLPMAETFDNAPAYYTYEPWVTYMPTDAYRTEWGILPVEVLPFFSGSDDWNVVLCGMGLADGCLGRCGFPVFSTLGLTDGVLFKAPFWTGSMSTPDVRITGITYGMTEPVEVGTVSSNGDWNEMNFELPAELLDKEWVNLFIEASFPEGASQWVCMDGYSLTILSGVTDTVLADGISVRPAAGAVEIVAPAEAPYAIYTVDGRRLAAGAGPASVNVATGIYIVSVGDHTFRIAVK